jgi:TRAP-type mannitol/chloroaromatic compound transport system substrate-binding protein
MSEDEKSVSRRRFLKASAIVGLVPVLAGCEQKSPGQSEPSTRTKTSWKMVTTWPANFPILQTGVERFADQVRVMSGGALDIEVHPGGALVPPLGSFDAVSQGSVQAASSASYYWAGAVPAAQFFTSVPFGFTVDQISSWVFAGGGLELWEEVYAPMDLVPIPMLTTSYQMGGWFNRRIDSIDDIRGLKMRIPGLGGKVMAKAGASVVLLPGAELFTSLQTGIIDATEWIGPYHDNILGFPSIARYYYHPGWQEPGPLAELMINKGAWEELSSELQQIVRAAAADTTAWSYAQFESLNAQGLVEIQSSFPDVEILRFPDQVLSDLEKFSVDVLNEESEKDAQFAKVREAMDRYRADLKGWREISMESYLPIEIQQDQAT